MKHVLVEPFDIDGNELSGQSLETAFVLGVEWQQFRDALQREVSDFSRTVHRINAERLSRMCARRNRRFRVNHLDLHWTEISVVGVTDTPIEA